MKHLISVIAISLLAGACSTQQIQTNDGQPKELKALTSLSIKSIRDAIDEDGDVSVDRLNAIASVARKAGRDRGMVWRNKQLNESIAKMNHELAIIFNFDQLLIGGIYLPPRVDKVESSISRRAKGQLERVRLGYRISTEPTLVTSPPTHLSYLYRLDTDLPPLNRIGLPVSKSKEEMEVWDQNVNIGWEEGVRHADIAMLEDIRLLRRDFIGMLRYVELANKGIISKPSLSKKDFGIVMSKDAKVLNIDSDILAIDKEALFQSTQLWEGLGEAHQ